MPTTMNGSHLTAVGMFSEHFHSVGLESCPRRPCPKSCAKQGAEEKKQKNDLEAAGQPKSEAFDVASLEGFATIFGDNKILTSLYASAVCNAFESFPTLWQRLFGQPSR